MKRTDRLNSLLKQIFSEVIQRKVRMLELHQLITITAVQVTSDLRHAKISVSIIGENKEQVIQTLQNLRKEIWEEASAQVRLKYFPALSFVIDTSVEDQMKIEEILQKVKKRDNKG